MRKVDKIALLEIQHYDLFTNVWYLKERFLTNEIVCFMYLPGLPLRLLQDCYLN